MAFFKEAFTSGLNTGNEPGVLGPGELSDMFNCRYRAGSDALWYPDGRDPFASASADASANIIGLRDCHFDNGDHYLIALASGADTRLKYASVSGAATTGTFTDLFTLPATGTSLEVSHFRNRFYLFSGATASASASGITPIGTNVVTYLSATGTNLAPSVRQHGMVPVVDAPAVTTAAGSFSQASGTFPAYYEYWTTEVAKLQQDGAVFTMESTYATDPVTVLIQTTGVVPTIQMPPVRNSITTHWRLYRSPRKDLATDKKFPVGFMIAEQQVVSSTAASASAAAFVSDTLTSSATGFIGPTQFNSAVAYSTWTNASNMATADASSATRAGVTFGVPLGQGTYGYQFGNFIGSIRGIEVQFKAAVSAGNPPIIVSVRIGKRQPNGSFVPDGVKDSQLATQTYLQYNTGALGINVTGTAAGVYTVGGPTSMWKASNVPPFADSDFDNNFMVVLEAIMPAGKTLSVDYVAVKVYYAATQDSTIQFPAVVYTFGDITAQVGKNGPPPSSNTGDVYEDTLVVNDMSSPSFIRYSYPGDAEAFPQTYFVDFETRENDKVTLIKVVNNRLVVGLDTSIWRCNYLPSERDASFDRGKAIEVISRSYGVINPMCACTFTMEGGQEFLAFVSQKGLHTTDGYNFQTRSLRLSWRGEMWTPGILPLNTAQATASAIALINNPEEQELLFYYRNDSLDPGQQGAFEDTFGCMHFSYAPGSVMDDGSFRASGPVGLRNHIGSAFADLKSAVPVPRLNGDTSIFLGYGATTGVGATATGAGAGQVWLEKLGSTVWSPNENLIYVSRKMFLAGEGNEFRLNEIREYSHSPAASNNESYTFTAEAVKTGTIATIQARKSNVPCLASATGSYIRIPISLMGEGIKIRRETQSFSALPLRTVEHMLLDVDGFGEEDSGK